MKTWVKFALVGGVACLISFTIFSPETSHWHYSHWSAAWFQAVGSLTAVMVALFYPWVTNRIKLKNMKSVVIHELETNIKMVREIAAQVDMTMPDGKNISAGQLNEAVAKNIDLRYWHKYGYEIANYDLTVFEKLRDVNKAIEAIANSDNENKGVKWFLQKSAADSALVSYEKVYA